ncbi:unnamed protein product, partial [Heterosigma akashiwo]
TALVLGRACSRPGHAPPDVLPGGGGRRGRPGDHPAAAALVLLRRPGALRHGHQLGLLRRRGRARAGGLCAGGAPPRDEPSVLRPRPPGPLQGGGRTSLPEEAEG